MGLAFFSTWTTYGTWLPGDERGWFQHGCLKSPDLMRRFESSLRMHEGAITLDVEQRRLVERTVAQHCQHRRWMLHAVNCRSNHVHVVVSAPGRAAEIPREQFKTWYTRKLNEQYENGGASRRVNWWTQRGWDEFINDQRSLLEVVEYVLNRQGPSTDY
jgi:REP element-mobilizing transposase RayT